MHYTYISTIYVCLYSKEDVERYKQTSDLGCSCFWFVALAGCMLIGTTKPEAWTMDTQPQTHTNTLTHTQTHKHTQRELGIDRRMKTNKYCSSTRMLFNWKPLNPLQARCECESVCECEVYVSEVYVCVCAWHKHRPEQRGKPKTWAQQNRSMRWAKAAANLASTRRQMQNKWKFPF